MAQAEIWTADELGALPLNERDAIVRASIVTDPKQIPAQFTLRARAKADAHIAGAEITQAKPEGGQGPGSKPSATDFLVIALPPLMEVIGERFDDLPSLYPDRSDYRYLVAKGILVRAFSITVQLIGDDIVLFGIDIAP